MPTKPEVGLFVTCLIDFFRPSAAFAAVQLLQDAGCSVTVPKAQTCCGQPAFNSGDSGDARAVARTVLKTFAPFQYVVVPSASCAGMIRHFPELFKDTEHAETAVSLAARTHELTGFLVDVLGVTSVRADFPHAAAYHDSCSALREMGIRDQPRQLLRSVTGLQLCELSDAETCCGFGGTFCVKYPEISGKMAAAKTRDITESGANTLVGPDMGCLLNMAGRLSRENSHIQVRHIAEVLAGQTAAPPIAGPETE
ncbi:MAG: (Fe-S)-binding protein [Acidobacteriota bacterium]|nr:(Fe-S)-binding protein [Acidobacteriota bacterium]